MAQESAPEVDESSEQGPAAEPSCGNTRRGLLVGAGLLGVAGIAAACGGSDDGDEDAAPSDPGGAGQSNGTTGGGGGGAVLAKTSDIPVGGGKIFKKQQVVVTQPAKGTFKAFSSECTHRGCPVGSVSGGTINCPCHGSKFKIADASVASGPASEPLATKDITVKGGEIKLA